MRMIRPDPWRVPGIREAGHKPTMVGGSQLREGSQAKALWEVEAARNDLQAATALTVPFEKTIVQTASTLGGIGL